MDVKQLWQNSGGDDETLNTLLGQGNLDHLQSKLPLKKLKSNLLIGLIWASLITALYITLLFFLHIWQAYATLAVLLCFNIILIIDTIKLYSKTPTAIAPSNSLKQELTTHYNSFQQWWAVQRKLSLIVYPIACTGGFMIGGVLGSGKSVEAFLYNPKMLAILGVTLLVVVPLCYFGAKAMFNYAYGKHLKRLKTTIDELS